MFSDFGGFGRLGGQRHESMLGGFGDFQLGGMMNDLDNGNFGRFGGLGLGGPLSRMSTMDNKNMPSSI